MVEQEGTVEQEGIVKRPDDAESDKHVRHDATRMRHGEGQTRVMDARYSITREVREHHARDSITREVRETGTASRER
jgi:hypothetical protein